jgi:hypothetical protein
MSRNLTEVARPLVRLFRSNAISPADVVRVCAILDANSFRIDGTGNRALGSIS